MPLKLTRRRGESILIGDDVVVTIEDCDRHQVRLTIAAPPQTRILRAELPERDERAAPHPIEPIV